MDSPEDWSSSIISSFRFTTSLKIRGNWVQYSLRLMDHFPTNSRDQGLIRNIFHEAER